jgi:hypothetical protein
MEKPTPHAKLIDQLGGPTVLAARLGIANRQTVAIWKVRGIPAKWLLKYPRVFRSKKGK